MIKYKYPAIKLAVIYFIIGGLWILLSDQVVSLFHPESRPVFGINILKGLFFVIITSTVLYYIASNYLQKLQSESIDREITKKELSRSESLFFNVTNTSPVAITTLDLQGQISYANKFAEDLLQLSKSSLENKTYNSPDWRITDLDGSKFPSEKLPFYVVLKTQKPIYNVQHAIVLSDNTQIFLSINASPLLSDDNKTLIGVVAVMRDITQKVRMENELRSSENKYRILFEDNPQPMWVYNLESLKFTDVNKAAIAKYGYSRDEFLSMTIKEIRPSEDVEKLEQYVNEVKSKGISRKGPFIWRHKLKNNNIIHVKILSHKIVLDNRECRIVLASDVTEVVKNENALKRSERRYRKIFENIIDVYFETTIGGKIVELSPSIRILSYGQYKREDLIGKLITSMYYDESERTSYIKKLIKYNRVDDYEVRLVNKDGRIIYCSLTAKLIDEDGDQRIVGSMRDISVRVRYEEDLIKAKEEAEKSNKLKSEFLAQMSHEIRTPLNIVLNSSQMIRGELEDKVDKEISEIFTIQKSAGKRIVRTIDSILNMSELQIGSYEPTFSKTDLMNSILSGLIDEYRFIAQEKNLGLNLNCNVTNPIIYADTYSVSQIFSNLIDNAIKYTNEGKVSVNIDEGNDNIFVMVQDTGKGISEEFLPHIFESFRQEQQGYTRKYEGNGLGLAIVSKFCEINNAQIKVDSEVGKGSTFTVEFKKPG